MKRFEVGDRVESGVAGSDEYDVGVVVEVLRGLEGGGSALVRWERACAEYWDDMDVLRFEGEG